MILCLGTTPAVQRVMVFPRLVLDAVNRAVRNADGPAGKSVNVAKCLKALGEEPLATGFQGGERGRYLCKLLEAKDIQHDFVTVAAQTRLCVTVIDQSAGAHTELVEEGGGVSPAECEQLQVLLARRTKTCRAMVLSGSLAAGVPVDFYLHAVELARAAGALCLVDAQGAPLLESLKANPELVKPNRAELAAALGRALADEAAVRSAMLELHERGAQRVVVTAGKEPALAFDGQCFWRITAPPVAALNPIGSGDAFAAALAWRLLRGDDLGEACRWGRAAGAANALTLMTGEIERADVDRLVKEVSVAKD
jgi:tagatose 6-phosphate kinase